MKRWLCCAVCLALLGGCFGAFAETTVGKWDDFFRTVEGHISFTMPCAPDVLLDPDLLEEEARQTGVEYMGWINCRHLICTFADDQVVDVNVADLTPMLNQIRQDYPGESEENYLANALTNFAFTAMWAYDGDFNQTPQAQILENEDVQCVALDFTFLSPDGMKGRGRGMMEGSLAVVLLGDDVPDVRHYLEDMRLLTDREAAQESARSPETVELFEMQVTFPDTPDKDQSEEGVFMDVFSEDYSYLSLQYLPLDEIMSGFFLLDRLMLKPTAKELGDQLVQEGILESYELTLYQQNVYRVHGLMPVYDYLPEEIARRRAKDVFITVKGAYFFEYDVNEVGQAWVDSVVFPEQ